MLIFAVKILLGPLIHLRAHFGRAVLLLIAVLGLTVVTQVGGAVLWMVLPLLEMLRRKGLAIGRWLAWSAPIFAFLVVYVVVAMAIVPPVAAMFGRQPLPCFASANLPLAASNAVFCLANRHYAEPQVRRILERVARTLAGSHPGAVVTYLDAGFPFLDGFPLLPHLSHRNGTTVDLAFFYADAVSGVPRRRAGAWAVGYWAFEQPRPGAPRPCRNGLSGLSLRWNMRWLQSLFSDVRLDETRTRLLIDLLVREAEAGGVRKILLEPHLRARWRLPQRVVRFQGCRAARHDDHVHLQFR